MKYAIILAVMLFGLAGCEDLQKNQEYFDRRDMTPHPIYQSGVAPFYKNLGHWNGGQMALMDKRVMDRLDRMERMMSDIQAHVEVLPLLKDVD